MIIEKIDELCVKNGTNLTALCKEITGSSGNLPTWKKDRIRPEWLRAICLKFNVSSDYLMDLPTSNTNSSLTQDEREALLRFNRLSPDYKIKTQAYMVDLYEKQENSKTFSEKLASRFDDDVDIEEETNLKQAK
ncbi:MAG: hypothetical protein LUC97_10275 [Clostridiales bacterium]|nr:hypothetical protein [Clostridiales bacterium]